MEPHESALLRKPLASTFATAGMALALTFGIAACVPAPDSTPAPAPSPVATTPSPAPPPPPPVRTYDSWMDAPQTQGDWTYRANARGSVASFGQSTSDAVFSISCDRAGNRILLSRSGTAAGQANIVIRSETATRALAAQGASTPTQAITAPLAARDPLLDAMALSKGRFAVESAGLPTLYLPAWAEVTRVIEDCR